MATTAFQVTPSELTAAANQVKEDNAQFRNRVSDLKNQQQELATMWKGDANTAFNNALNEDSSRWDEFATLVDQYAEALIQIAQIMEEAESEASSIASNRTYG